MKAIILFFLVSINFLFATTLDSKTIKKLIGRTIILGFEGKTLTENLKKDIDKYNLGGVILFDKYYKSKKKKNILNPKQLKKLNTQIQNYSKYKMFISIDQEGGWVSRLNPSNGFLKTPKADTISKKEDEYAKKVYKNLANELSFSAINLNFAPVVDLKINPKNKVIVYQGRSYSNNPKEVVKYSKIFIEQMNKKNILSVLKHFPGHSSSKNDSHKDFVDISNTWKKKELIPYKNLIKEKKVKAIMTAHVFNKKLDSKYPATLSYKINSKLLREKLNFKGLIISDDLQMKAITKHYNLRQTLKLAINAGVNVLLFGNHLENKNIKLETIVNTIYELILKKEISLSSIIKSNELINQTLKAK